MLEQLEETYLVCEMEMKHVPVHVSVCVLDCMCYNLLWYRLEKSEHHVIFYQIKDHFVSFQQLQVP